MPSTTKGRETCLLGDGHGVKLDDGGGWRISPWVADPRDIEQVENACVHLVARVSHG